MPEILTPGARIDNFMLEGAIHSSAQSMVFRAHAANAADSPGFPLVLKAPRLGHGESDESLLNFETEAMILPALTGPYVPRFVAAGDLTRTPYLVMEWVEGESLLNRLREPGLAGVLAPAEVAHVGAAIAEALHSLHRQGTIHHDLKPANVVLSAGGAVKLIDFGVAYHKLFPDLLAEERRFASGTIPYVSPEQVMDLRSDPRSDLFALGVVLYQMATGELPFGSPQTYAGIRDRLWKIPAPPRSIVPDLPPALQEVILRCMEPDAEERYQSAAHVAFDLRHPDQVVLTERAARTEGAGLMRQAVRWWRGHNELAGRLNRNRTPATAPVIMVAVDTSHPHDERHPELQRATRSLLSLSGEFRLVCVSVIRGKPVKQGEAVTGTSDQNFEHLVRLRHWVAPLRLPPQRLSLHVVESLSPAATLLDFATRNHVDLIVLGAPGPSQQAMAWWRSVASSVTANAHCSVHIVRVPERPWQTGVAGNMEPPEFDLQPASTREGRESEGASE